jgi:hypothetical protein
LRSVVEFARIFGPNQSGHYYRPPMMLRRIWRNNVKSPLAPHCMFRTKRNWSLFASGVLVAGLWLASHGVADAIVFKGVIDPQFQGGSTPATSADLAWSAEVLFDLENCAASVGLTTCGTMDLLSATGTLYDVADPNHTPVSTPSILTYYSGAPNPSFIQSVLFDSNGDVIGLNTSLIGETIASAGSFLPPDGTSALWLQFFAPNPNIIFLAELSPPTGLGGYLIVSPCSGPSTDLSCPSSPGDDAVRSDAATVQFSAVPEPGSLLLTMVALASVGFIRRRRSP